MWLKGRSYKCKKHFFSGCRVLYGKQAPCLKIFRNYIRTYSCSAVGVQHELLMSTSYKLPLKVAYHFGLVAKHSNCLQCLKKEKKMCWFFGMPWRPLWVDINPSLNRWTAYTHLHAIQQTESWTFFCCRHDSLARHCSIYSSEVFGRKDSQHTLANVWHTASNTVVKSSKQGSSKRLCSASKSSQMRLTMRALWSTTVCTTLHHILAEY